MQLIDRMNMANGEKFCGHVIKNVNKGINFYDTFCLICAELNINLEKITEDDFDACFSLLESFCLSCNDHTGYTVSIWFDENY